MALLFYLRMSARTKSLIYVCFRGCLLICSSRSISAGEKSIVKCFTFCLYFLIAAFCASVGICIILSVFRPAAVVDFLALTPQIFLAFRGAGHARRSGLEHSAAIRADLTSAAIGIPRGSKLRRVVLLIYALRVTDVRGNGGRRAVLTVSLTTAVYDVRFSTLLTEIRGADRPGSMIFLILRVLFTLIFETAVRAALGFWVSLKHCTAVDADPVAQDALALRGETTVWAEVCEALVSLKRLAAPLAG